jgi:anti-sigma-28 factor FlgM
MNEINTISTLATSPTLREFANQAYPRSDSGNSAILEDSVEISELADFLSRLAELPEARARRIVEIRNAIKNETYETPKKLEIAAEGVLAAL